MRVYGPRTRDLRWGILLYILFCRLPCFAQSHQTGSIGTALPDAPGFGILSGQDPIEGQSLGSVSGMVVDQNGNFVVAARVSLASQDPAKKQEVLSDGQGRFQFTGVAAGPFELTITAEGFATQTRSGILNAGETLEMPDISLPVGIATTEVRVSITKYELAEEQVKIEEKQRVLGFIPNFYVTYDPHAPSLSPKQKFELAWKTNVDPITFVISGGVAGVEQATNAYSGYGQGAQGYAKRYGASYGDGFIGTMIDGAILPSLLKQDPRYFYKGTGSTRSRVLYALANVFICKGDNGHWQANYSGILGNLAAGGISNLYYPASNSNIATVTFENALITMGSSGITNLFQEFLARKLTPHASSPQPGQP